MDNIAYSIVSTVLTNSVCRWKLIPKLPVLSTVASVLAVKNFVALSVRNDLSSDTIQKLFRIVSASLQNGVRSLRIEMISTWQERIISCTWLFS